MTNNEIREKFYSPSIKFYGRMYGNEYILTNDKNGKTVKMLDEIIRIDKKELKIGINGDCFIYRWGWPGPDINLYYFKDYGKTWAFNMKDFKNV